MTVRAGARPARMRPRWRVVASLLALLVAGTSAFAGANEAAGAGAGAGAAVASAGTSPAVATWVTLGTVGGPPIHASQSQIANALVVGDAVYLFDVGNGVLRQVDAAKLGVRRIRAVFLSHHHFDHNADVGPVLMSWWLFGTGAPLPILGPPGTITLVNGLVAANAPTVDASFPTRGPAKAPLVTAVRATDFAAEMRTPVVVYQDENVRVSAIGVDHFQVPPSAAPSAPPHAVAFRVEAGGRTIVYSGDTGPSAGLRTLARDADLLVTEVVDLRAIDASLRASMPQAPAAVVEDLVAGMAKNHLTPQAIGELARDTRVKRVVLTHFVPGYEQQPDAANYTRGIAPAYAGPVSLARDLDRF